MYRIFSSTFLVLLVWFFYLPELRSEGPNPDICTLVSIDLPKEVYESAAFVSARLETRGPAVIYYWPPSFLAQRKSGGTWLPASSKDELRTKLKAHAVAFHFDSPRLIGIDWKGVGSDGKEGSFTVPAGHYRLTLRFSLNEPTEQKELRWCTVESQEFTLERDAPAYVTK